MSQRRRWLFRCCAIAMSLLPFVVFEVMCRLGGWASQSPQTAFAEFVAVRPLFEVDHVKGVNSVASNRREFFAHDEFPLVKSHDTFRIFVFGGSTVQGRPFSIPTSFPTFLRIALERARPSANWEVVNCGGISYASYRLLPIMQECLDYEPDLYIVCSGHNEFLECITYNDVRRASPLIRRSYSLLYRSHGFRLLSNAFHSSGLQATSVQQQLPTEVDAILDHRDGLEAYRREVLNRGDVVREFRNNLTRMTDLCEDAAVPLLLVKPPSNLRDCPPFKSEFGEDVSATVRDEIRESLNHLDLTLHDDAVKQLQRLADADPRFAFTWYQLGHAWLAKGFGGQAHEAFVRARDEDICPLRMTSDLEDVIATVASEEAIPLLDVHNMLATDCRDGIVDDSVLVDHVHPSFTSNQKIAIALLRRLNEQNLIPIEDSDWPSKCEAAFSDHLQSLDSLYFLRGQRTLKSLREWTQGRADGPPLRATTTHSRGETPYSRRTAELGERC